MTYISWRLRAGPRVSGSDFTIIIFEFTSTTHLSSSLARVMPCWCISSGTLGCSSTSAASMHVLRVLVPRHRGRRWCRWATLEDCCARGPSAGQLDATQLAQVPMSSLKQAEDVMHLKQIKTMLAQIEKTNEIKNVAMSW